MPSSMPSSMSGTGVGNEVGSFESSPAIADGRVYVGAGDDGFYCLDLRGDGQGKAKVPR